MKVWRILTLTMVLLIVGAPLVAGFMNWLAPAVRAGVLSLAPPAAAALALVLYFNWRARLKSRILGDAGRDQELADSGMSDTTSSLGPAPCTDQTHVGAVHLQISDFERSVSPPRRARLDVLERGQVGLRSGKRRNGPARVEKAGDRAGATAWQVGLTPLLLPDRVGWAVFRHTCCVWDSDPGWPTTPSAKRCT